MLGNNINTGEVPIDRNRVAFIEHIKREGIRLTSIYGLDPIVSGSSKQNAFAEDIRTKFLIDFEKKSASLSESDKEAIKQEWLSHLEARFWLDNKERAKRFFKEAVSVQKPISQTPAAPGIGVEAPKALPGFAFVIFDCSKGDILKISFSAECNVADILRQFKFTPLSPFEWVYMVSIESVNRSRIIEEVTREIVNKGFPFKRIPYVSPEAPHDGYLRLVDGKLCIDCGNMAVFRAFSHIGHQRVYLDKARKEQIQELLKQYDVLVMPDVTGFGDE